MSPLDRLPRSFRFVVQVVLTPTALLFGCSTSSPDAASLLVDSNPFIVRSVTISRSDESADSPRVSRLCLASLVNRTDLQGAAERLEAFDRLIEVELAEAGFEVMREADFGRTWKRARFDVGDLYDPHDGLPDRNRIDRARRVALAAIQSEHGCDFRVEPSLALVSVLWSAGQAEWDGVVDGERRFWSIAAEPLVIPAMSLRVYIYDVEGSLVYFRAGGIELAASYRSEFGEEPFRLVDADLLLTNDERNRKAIRLAIEAMIPGR